MKHSSTEDTLLPADLRVLDLTTEQGYLCGKILGDLGADVIKVERPGGDAGKSIGPFYHDTPHPEKSLFWFAFNANKRGITLNIDCADGQELLRRLVARADIVIESFPVGHMDKLGLGYSQLRELNPGVILTSITPFGQEGPYKDYKACDIVAMGMGGIMYLSGDSDRPPTRISVPQAPLHAGAEAAAATMIALYSREMTGEGQQVDVSMQHSVIVTTLNNLPWYTLSGRVLKRAGSSRTGVAAAGSYRQQWACKDGYVSMAMFFGRAGVVSNQALMQWMSSEGAIDDSQKKDWDIFDMAQVNEEWFERISKPISKFLLTHTKAELYEEALKRRIMLYPVSTPKDLVKSPQLRARGFWTEVEHPELHTTITYPGAFLQASETPLRIRRRAPLIGEHNEEVYGELGISKEALLILKQSNVV